MTSTARCLPLLLALCLVGCGKKQPPQKGKPTRTAPTPSGNKLAASQAIVLDFKGKVSITRKGGETVAAQAAAQLQAGDQLELADGAWVKLQLLDGPDAHALPELTGPATVVMDPKATGGGSKNELADLVGQARDGLKEMLKDGDASTTGAIRDKAVSQIGPDEVWIVSPASTAIRHNRPRLSWLRGKNVKKVRVAIDATSEEDKRYVEVEGLAADQLDYPEKAASLPPGTYLWVVSWGEEASGYFTVLSEKESAAVESGLARLDASKTSDTTRKLLKIQLLARHKLYLEALDLVLALERSAPDNAHLEAWRKRLWHLRMYRRFQRPSKK